MKLLYSNRKDDILDGDINLQGDVANIKLFFSD